MGVWDHLEPHVGLVKEWRGVTALILNQDELGVGVDLAVFVVTLRITRHDRRRKGRLEHGNQVRQRIAENWYSH
jgi:hypothetical protein